jgi:general secretion pathway protein L
MSTPAAGRLQDRLGRFGARLSGSMLRTGTGGFLSWWGTALASWLPPRVRRLLGMDRGRLLLLVEGEVLRLRLQRGDEIRDLGNVPALREMEAGDPLAPVLGLQLSDLPRWLLLPAGTSLRRRLSLPAAALERLRDVVGFEIERQTPFTADAVAYDARVIARRDGDGPIDAELVAVPRAALDPQLAALGPVAPSLAGIDVAGPDGAPLQINLLPPSQRQSIRNPWQTWNLAFVAVAILATGFALWQVLENRRAAAEDFDAEVEREAGPARRAAAQHQELVNLIEGQAFLQRTRTQRPTAVEVMDELSRRLPDGTYLEKLAIEENRLTLIGLSNEAPALIGRLQDSPLWSSPALAGALQTDPMTRKDRFTLTADLGPANTSKERPGARPGE